MQLACNTACRAFVLALALALSFSGTAHAHDSIALYDEDSGQFYLRSELASVTGKWKFR